MFVEQTMLHWACLKKSDALHVEAGICFSVLLVAQPVEGWETIAEVASNEEAVWDGQHPGPGTFWVFSKHRPSGPMLSISRNVRPSVCLSVRLFTFEVPFKRFFAPTSWSRMSNIFRDSESLGKSNGKKWSNIWIFLFASGLKSPREKKVFFCADFALQNMLKTTLPDGLETSGRRVYR